MEIDVVFGKWPDAVWAPQFVRIANIFDDFQKMRRACRNEPVDKRHKGDVTLPALKRFLIVIIQRQIGIALVLRKPEAVLDIFTDVIKLFCVFVEILRAAQ